MVCKFHVGQFELPPHVLSAQLDPCVEVDIRESVQHLEDALSSTSRSGKLNDEVVDLAVGTPDHIPVPAAGQTSHGKKVSRLVLAQVVRMGDPPDRTEGGAYS